MKYECYSSGLWSLKRKIDKKYLLRRPFKGIFIRQTTRKGWNQNTNKVTVYQAPVPLYHIQHLNVIHDMWYYCDGIVYTVHMYFKYSYEFEFMIQCLKYDVCLLSKIIRKLRYFKKD